MGRWDDSEWTKDDLVGGHPVLDFVNTAGGRTKARDVERLTNFALFLKCAVVADVLTTQEAADFQRQAQVSPKAANTALSELLSFREALHVHLMAEQAS